MLCLIIFQLSWMAEQKFQEAMQTILKNASKDLQKIEPTANLKLGTVLQNCFKKSNDNPDRFASCMIDTQKKIQQLSQSFQFKQLFLNNFVQNCVAKNDAEKCKTQGQKILTNSINSFIKSIESL